MSERQEACWDLVMQMKADVLSMLDSENDGVRTHAIKFVETLIITLSPRTADSDVPKRQEGDISLDKVPKDHSYIRHGTDATDGSPQSCPVLLCLNWRLNPQMFCVRRGKLSWRSC